MSLIQTELDRIGKAIQHSDPVPHYAELYAAQQALLWATDPHVYKAPYDLLVSGTLQDSEDCREGNGHSPSSNNPGHRASEPSPIPTCPTR